MNKKAVKLRKVTLHLPADLVREAISASKQTLTETVRQGLKLVATGSTYDKLLKQRGKTNLKLNIATLREDR